MTDNIEQYTSFEKEDTVTLKEEYKKYSAEHERIFGLNFVVNKSKLSNLGDMKVEVIYLDKEDINIENPFLADCFKKVI